MTDAPDENQQTKADQVEDQVQDSNDPLQFDVSKPNTLRSLSLPKISLPKFKLKRPKVSFKKIDFLWFWLIIIALSYACMGYFLSILITIPARQNLAIAGFAIFGLFPTITAFADYALMKWSYLLSGFLILGGLIFLVKLEFYFIILAIITWVGLTAIAFVGDMLIKKRKLWPAIGILTIPCLIGLAIGHQIWRLAASWS